VKVLETDRLILRKFSVEDAPFILELVNQPAFLRFIGDKGVRTLDEARDYILQGPVDSYDRLGFGVYRVELKENGTAIGLCGLIKRESLEDVDIGYAFLPEFWGKGYAFEAAAAMMEFGKSAFGLQRIVAIVSTENYGSIKVLEKIGLKFERMIRLFEDEEEIKLFTPAD
jgi:RimJ/RimL family protein N-acetyltransferase